MLLPLASLFLCIWCVAGFLVLVKTPQISAWIAMLADHRHGSAWLGMLVLLLCVLLWPLALLFSWR